MNKKNWRRLLLSTIALACMAETIISLTYDSPHRLLAEQSRCLQAWPSELTPLLPYCGWFNRVGSSLVNQEEKTSRVTVWPNGQRASRLNSQRNGQPKVLALGCSYIYGFALNDQDTLLWKLNERYPQAVFDNYGVVGWGTYQSLLLGEYLLQKQSYDLVLYFYILNHRFRSERGCYIGEFAMGHWYTAAPEVFVKDQIMHVRPSFYFHWPWQEFSALAEYGGRLYAATRQRYYGQIKEKERSQDGDEALLAQIIYQCNNFNKICQAKHSKFALVVLEDRNFNLPKWRSQADFDIVDLRFGTEKAEYRNGGQERFHPNEEAQILWLNGLSHWLEDSSLISFDILERRRED